ncbi:MAG: serine protease [bacterium]
MTTPLLALLLLAAGVFAQGQAPSGDSRYIVEDENFEKAAGRDVERLAKDGKLINFSEIAKKAPKMRPGSSMPSVSTHQLPPPELADALRHSTVALGLRYQEPRSKKWRFMIGATAFAIAPEVLSTSLHVMTIDPAIMREAQAVAVTEDGKVFPVAEIIAASDRADSCLIRVPGLDLPPLPLRGGVRPGEQIWCMSHPDGFAYMFTGGQVARISRDRYDEKHQPALHVEVTAEYCPGSSGGAITDAAGNVVAQVSSINNYDGFTSRDGKAVNGIVSARTCTAAEELMALTSPGENEPVPTPSPKPQPRHRSPKDSPRDSPKAKPSPSVTHQGG